MKYPKQAAYANLINSFIRQFEIRCGRVIVFPSSESEWFTIEPSNDGTTRWNFELFMHLPKWKVRGEFVYIIMKARERIQRIGKEMPIVTSSTVQLSYCEIEEECELLHSIHYDFGAPQERHPLFHAQLTNEVPEFPDQVQRELEIIVPRARPKLFKFARIPTSDMTLPSALLCLAADHCEDTEAFTAFRDTLRAARSNMQYANTAGIEAAISQFNPASLCSSSWFP